MGKLKYAAAAAAANYRAVDFLCDSCLTRHGDWLYTLISSGWLNTDARCMCGERAEYRAIYKEWMNPLERLA